MAVVDIRSQGGILPNPVLDNSGRPVTKEPTKDIIDQIEADTERSIRLGSKLRTLERYGVLANPQQNQPSPALAENTRVDVASIVASQNKLVSDLITQIGSKGSDSGNNPLLTYLLDELRETKSRLEGSDPIAALTNSMQGLAVMKDLLKKDLGIGQSGVVGGGAGDIHAMIELEKIKTDSAERMFQMQTQFNMQIQKWKEEGDERRRRWEIEDRQREEDRAERRADREAAQKKGENTAGMFQDIAGALVGSLGQGGSAEVAQQPAPVSGVEGYAGVIPSHSGDKTPKMFRAKKFKCFGCKELIDAPTEDIFKCPKCGFEYEMRPMDNK